MTCMLTSPTLLRCGLPQWRWSPLRCESELPTVRTVPLNKEGSLLNVPNVSAGLFKDDKEVIAERLGAALALARADSARTAEVLRLVPGAGAKGARAADLPKPWAASSRSEQRPADPTSLTHHPHGTSSGTNPEDLRPAASLWAAQTSQQGLLLVCPVGHESTTYGLRRRCSGCQPLFWFVRTLADWSRFRLN